MLGILLVDKPAGWTSFDAVNYVRKIARQAVLEESYKVYKAESRKSTTALDFKDFQLSTPLPKVKVGHTGTLDPFATGLLVLLIGSEYTRKAAELSKADKTYEVTMRFGQVSTTGDPEGEITEVDGPQPTHEEVEAVLQQFTGEIEQIPPAYSAIKINGQRAYKLAREGKAVTLEPRKVTIYDLRLVGYDYPEARLTASVSSGTYIRTLVEDIAKALGTGAFATALRRTRVGTFSIDSAMSVEGLTADRLAAGLIEL